MVLEKAVICCYFLKMSLDFCALVCIYAIPDSCATIFQSRNTTHLNSKMSLRAVPNVKKVEVKSGCILHGYSSTDFSTEILKVIVP